MATPETQDSASAPTAPEAPSAVQDRPIGTSAKLFPEQFETAPEPEVVDPGTEAPPIVEPPEPAQAPEAPVEPEVLDISAFQGKKVRVKIDGQEMDVPAETLLKNYQLGTHLDRKGQQIGEQRKALEELRKELLEKTQADTDAIEEAVESGESPKEIQQLKTELDQTRKKLAEISAVTSPLMFERSVAALDQQVKSNLGFDDFRAYVPKIQEFIRGQLVDPENPTPQEMAIYDSQSFYLQKFQEMKLKELSKPVAAPTPAAPVTPIVPVAPKLTKIVNVESGSGAIPETPNEAQDQKIQKAFSDAKELGTNEAWAYYWSLKTQS